MAHKLFLIGPMGAGKSTLAHLLAWHLSWEGCDLDREIEDQAGQSIAQIFREEGETGFRDREQRKLSAIARSRSPLVVATGGGVVLREANRALMAEAGWRVYLRTPVETLLARLVSGEERPLLQVADPRARLAALLAEREAFYCEADRILDTQGREPEAMAQELAQWVTRGIAYSTDEGR